LDTVLCALQVVKVDELLGLDLTLLRWYEPGESYYVQQFFDGNLLVKLISLDLDNSPSSVISGYI
jgi:hypothetical protein